MIIDILVAEIGSTTTKVSAFDGINDPKPRFLGQGSSPTTVISGDVTIGLKKAIEDLKVRLKTTELEARESFACSSAAGGLKMSVHGLVYDMTAKAAKEAALGAGANLHLLTAGLLTPENLTTIQDLNLNIIMIAGGVDYGEKYTSLTNAKAIARLRLNIPVIYAGNIENQDSVKMAFTENGQEKYLYITENVYPKIDVLQVEAARVVIQNAFETHITKAPGMEKVRDIISQSIIPTPGAVLKAAILMQKEIGDLVVADVGGATTDIHSVTEGSPEVQHYSLAPEPFAKRTVEGDLGVYINRDRLLATTTPQIMAKELHISETELFRIIDSYKAIPDLKQIPVVEYLTKIALCMALDRHVGRYANVYGNTGKSSVPEGKDLTNVSYIIGTGGALSRLPSGKKNLSEILIWRDPRILLPPPSAKILIDQHYIMAAVGAFCDKYPDAAIKLIKNSFGI
ncbi:MAG: GlmL-related ornithine degradation protein [Candidatus Izemoplasmatales bacterium]